MANFWDLPEDILVEVLSLVPTKELICSCRLVCLQWRELVDSLLLWKLKYRHNCKDLNKGIKDAYYLFCHLEKNLIKNPCGEEGLDFWEIETPSEGEWKVEVIAGLGKTKVRTTDFLMKNSEVEYKAQHQVNKCFATYNGLCIKSQRITLKDHVEFYSTPGNEYQLTVKLLAEDFTTLKEHSFTNGYGGHRRSGKWHRVSMPGAEKWCAGRWSQPGFDQ
uniref:Uncharacterized protein n=1 Tax=Varanus komodoensis TaxID=61221 RepID=A0A8D2Q4Z4_VARKO